MACEPAFAPSRRVGTRQVSRPEAPGLECQQLQPWPIVHSFSHPQQTCSPVIHQSLLTEASENEPVQQPDWAALELIRRSTRGCALHSPSSRCDLTTSAGPHPCPSPRGRSLCFRVGLRLPSGWASPHREARPVRLRSALPTPSKTSLFWRGARSGRQVLLSKHGCTVQLPFCSTVYAVALPTTDAYVPG